MESLMSGLMARAAGKSAELPAFLITSHHHDDSFVSNEDLRQQSCYPSTDEDSRSSTSSPEISDQSWSGSQTSSYMSLYSPAGYATSPTYIRGDYYDLSPPSSPSISAVKSSHRQPQRLSFSIQSILGRSEEPTSERSAHVNSPAHVTSAMTSPHFRLSQSDWSIFQPSIRSSSSRAVDGVNQYWCHACEDFCVSEAEVERHQQLHTGNGDACKLKRIFFNKHGYVTAHVQTDFMNRIKCGLCERVVTRHFFHKHLRMHDGHICEVCDQECPSNSRLRDHMNTHTGAIPYRCSVCEQHFSDKLQLANHSRKHRQSSVRCRFCTKMFQTKHSCNVHERIHTGVCPFVCKVPGCKKSFRQKVQLQLHQNNHHVICDAGVRC